MAYSSIAQVNAILPNQQSVTATSDPDVAQVQLWIDQDEARVDVALAAGGDNSPAIDSAQQKAIAILVSANVSKRVVSKRTGEPLDESDFTKVLDQMRAGEWAGAVDGGGTVGPSSYTMNSPDSPDSSVNPVFMRDQAHNW